jgi:5-methylcytosine-specific restriction endonuclease McrBC regulatory subunit McrC
MNVLSLREFERRMLPGADPSLFENARTRLAELVYVSYEMGGVEVGAKHHVGYIPVHTSLMLKVIPKFVGSEWDFFYLLERAGASPKVFADARTKMTREPGLADRPAEFIIRELLRLLAVLRRDGLYRKSAERVEPRPGVKGKILLTETIRLFYSRSQPQRLQCAYFDATADIPENCAIKLAIERLIETPGLPRDIRRQLREYHRIFQVINPRPREDVCAFIRKTLERGKIPDSRDYYRSLLSLCLFILESSTIAFREGEDITLCAFAMDMEEVFEKFVYACVRNSLAGSGVEVFKADKSVNRKTLFSNADEPLITPDIVIRNGSATRFVLDAKYVNRLPNADEFYQILAYTVSYGCPLGALVLPSNGPRAPIEYRTAGQRVFVYFMNLNDPVQGEMDIGAWIRPRL